MNNPIYKDRVDRDYIFCSLDVDPGYDADIAMVDTVPGFAVKNQWKLLIILKTIKNLNLAGPRS